MSIYKFVYDSDHFSTNGEQNQMEVEISVDSFDKEEYSFEIESIFDMTDSLFRELGDFPEKEQAEIDSKAEIVAQNKADEAYQDYMSYRADLAYDRYKEGY